MLAPIARDAKADDNSVIYVIQEKLNAIDSAIAPIVSMLGSHVNAFAPDGLRSQSSHPGMHTLPV